MLPPTSTTSPTNSCPSTVSGIAFGTKPFIMCKSLVQIDDSFTFTIASFGSIIVGTGFSTSSICPFLCHISAFILVIFSYFL